MTTVAVHAQGSAAVEVAWERYARPSLWASWSPPIRSVDIATKDSAADRIAPGLRGTVHGPVGVRVRFVVIAVDGDARTWSWQARFGPVTLTLDHAVQAETAGSSTLLRITGPAPVVLAYAPLARLSLVRLVRA